MPGWLTAFPTCTCTETSPAGVSSGIFAFTWNKPATASGAAPAYRTSAGLPLIQHLHRQFRLRQRRAGRELAVDTAGIRLALAGRVDRDDRPLRGRRAAEFTVTPS